MKKIVLIFLCGVNAAMLFGMKVNEQQQSRWEKMYESGEGGFPVILKNGVEYDTLNLSSMNLMSEYLDDVDKVIPLVYKAYLEVSRDELKIDFDDVDVIFQKDPIIKILSVARNPKLTTLPDCLTKFVDLEKLIISFSGIYTFQPVFLKLPKLKHLVLSKFQFNQLSEDECFKDFVMKLDFVTIEHTKNELPLTDKAVEIAQSLTSKKLLDK